MIKVFFTILFFLFVSTTVSAQTDTIVPINSFTFDVEKDVLSLKRKSSQITQTSILTGINENSNQTLYNTYVLERAKIEFSGVMTIPEALRLIPGCFVREQSKGNFDIILSGTNSISKSSNPDYSSLGSNSILLLIDGVPATNNFDNKIWWENLPGIQNIEQIEVLFAPIVSIHGMTSSGGAINIITRKNSLDRLHLVAEGHIDTQSGSTTTLFAESSINENFQINLGLNYNFLERPTIDYYVASQGKNIPHDSLLFHQPEVDQTHVYPTMAQNSLFVQGQVLFQPSKDMKLDLQFRYMSSEAQTSHMNYHQLFLMQRKRESNSVTLSGNFKNLHFYTKGDIGTYNLAEGVRGYTFQNRDIQSKVEYRFQQNDFILAPSVTYNHSKFDNTNSTENNQENVLSSHENTINHLSTNILANYKLGGLAIQSVFGYNYYLDLEQGLPTWTIAAGYSIKDKYRVRASATHSSDPITFWRNSIWNLTENQTEWKLNIQPQTAQNYEVGLRTKVLWFLETDISLYIRNMNNFNVVERTSSQIQHLPNETELEITGVQFTVNFDIGKLQVNPFFNFQKLNLLSPEGTTGAEMPNFIAGLSGNYSMFYNRVRLNALLSYTNGYTLRYDNENYEIGNHLRSYFRVGYSFWKDNFFFISAKNVLLGQNREYLYADPIFSTYSLGLRFNIHTVQ